MPIQRCKHGGQFGYQFGESGKCYIGAGALAKARRQERAIRATGWTENKQPVIRISPLAEDPTQTFFLRKRLGQRFANKFNRLKAKLIDLVEKEDAFGLITNVRWEFLTTTKQLEGFREWLFYQIGIEVLGVVAEQQFNQYWREYIQKAYEQGAGRAFLDTKKAYAHGYAADESTKDFYRKSKLDFLQSAFGTPIHRERLELLAGRVFTDLKGVTDDMAVRMSRVLVDGLARGENPRVLARQLAKEVDVGRTRSQAIARTEIVRAHNEGQLDAMERLGVDQIGVAVEWRTSGRGTSRQGNPSPCPLCAPLQHVVMSVKQARGLLPRHPNCMCSYLPANVGESQTKQKRTAAEIRASIDQSIQAEISKKSKRTLAEQKQISRWAGADLVARRSPRSVLSKNYNPNQPRDEKGRWGSGGGASSHGKTFEVYRGVGEGSATGGFEWFSENPELATRYADFRGGSLKKAKIVIAKSLDVGNGKEVLTPRSFSAKALSQTTVEDRKIVLSARKRFLEHFGDSAQKVSDYWNSIENKKETRVFLETLGFDSISMIEQNSQTYVVFDPTRITYER